MSGLASIVNRFTEKKIVIVGDLVADQFLRGTIERVSREAPVFILRHDETVTLPGGGANAAANVASLGGKAVVIGVVGTDEQGNSLLSSMKRPRLETSGIITTASRATPTKVRVLAGQHYAPRQQVIRIDYSESQDIDPAAENGLLGTIEGVLEDASALIISDYGHGTVTEAVSKACIEGASSRGIPVIADSRSNLLLFGGCSSATPNQEEVEHVLGSGFDESGCEGLRRDLGLDALLVTLGNKGMLLVEEGRAPALLAAVGPDEPVDVTGAGDTVIAAYSLALASGAEFREAALIANHAGGLVVMKRGTSTVARRELLDSLERENRAGRSAVRS